MASPPPSAARPILLQRSNVNSRSTLMPTDSAMRRLSTGRADLGADIGALECVPKHGDEREAEHDEERAITREITEPEVDVALQPIRQRHRLRNRAVEIKSRLRSP